jgi:hypothetical protein
MYVQYRKFIIIIIVVVVVKLLYFCEAVAVHIGSVCVNTVEYDLHMKRPVRKAAEAVISAWQLAKVTTE